MLIQWAQWWTLACNDVRLRYRRTTLGPLWITVGLAATVSSVGLLYGSLFGNRLSDYLPYFATGLVVWAFIASAIMLPKPATLKGFPKTVVRIAMCDRGQWHKISWSSGCKRNVSLAPVFSCTTFIASPARSVHAIRTTSERRWPV